MSTSAFLYLHIPNEPSLRGGENLPTAADQRAELEHAVTRRGLVVSEVFADDATGRDLPEFHRMCALVERGGVAVVAVYSVAVLARSMRELVRFLRLMQKSGTGLVVVRERVDTLEAGGATFFQAMEIAGEYDRRMASQRVRMGLVRAAAGGVVLGRPAVVGRREDEVRRQLALGAGVLTVVRRTGVSKTAVRRIRDNNIQRTTAVAADGDQQHTGK